MQSDWKRNIILFLTSQTISYFGSLVVGYAIFWYITLQTESGLMMTVSIVAEYLPTFFLSPFAGVWADRHNRKWLIVLSDGLTAFATLILALVFLAGYKSIWLLFAMSAVRSVGAGVQMPAVGAILPDMVPEDQLTRVNAANSSIRAIVSLISPMASATLLSVIPIEPIFFIDAATAAIAIFTMLAWVRVSTHPKAMQAQQNGYLDDLREGVRYVRRHAYLKAFLVFCAIFFVLAAPGAFLTTLQVARSFGEEVWRLSAIEVAYSLGMMLGGAIIGAWGGFRNRVHTMALSVAIVGICTVALGVVPVFWIYLLFMATIGIAMPMFNTPANVLLQEKVETDFLGRIFGILSMITSSMMPLGMVVFGPIADLIPIEWLLVGTGLVQFLMSFALLGSRPLVEAGRNPSKAHANP
ncbi:MAG TPA: MFS transporter [Symbiobacteriaceae bacterium]